MLLLKLVLRPFLKTPLTQVMFIGILTILATATALIVNAHQNFSVELGNLKDLLRVAVYLESANSGEKNAEIKSRLIARVGEKHKVEALSPEGVLADLKVDFPALVDDLSGAEGLVPHALQFEGVFVDPEKLKQEVQAWSGVQDIEYSPLVSASTVESKSAVVTLLRVFLIALFSMGAFFVWSMAAHQKEVQNQGLKWLYQMGLNTSEIRLARALALEIIVFTAIAIAIIVLFFFQDKIRPFVPRLDLSLALLSLSPLVIVSFLLGYLRSPGVHR